MVELTRGSQADRHKPAHSTNRMPGIYPERTVYICIQSSLCCLLDLSSFPCPRKPTPTAETFAYPCSHTKQSNTTDTRPPEPVDPAHYLEVAPRSTECCRWCIRWCTQRCRSRMVVSIRRTYSQPGSRYGDGDGDRLRCTARDEQHPVGSGKMGTGETTMVTGFSKDRRRPHA